MTDPKVTVLMPIYNGTSYMREAIESVLAQTYTEFEFLIIDDASTDESVSVIESYKDERIRLVKNESNIGQVRTLNKGLRLARGAYIARLDQDDSSLPIRLEKQVKVLETQPEVAVVGTWLHEIDQRGNPTDLWRGQINDLPEFLFAILRDRLFVYHPSVMFRRELVLELQGYDEEFKYCEDQDLWRRIALAGYEARVIREPLTRYRIHAGQQSNQQSQIQSQNHIRSQERFIRALVDKPSARLLRLFMICSKYNGDEFWDECNSAEECHKFISHLAHVQKALQARWMLSNAQSDKLSRLISRQALIVAGRAWRKGIMRQWQASLPMFFYSLRRGDEVEITVGTLIFSLIFILSPLLAPIRLIKQRVTLSVQSLHLYLRFCAWLIRVDYLFYWYRRLINRWGA